MNYNSFNLSLMKKLKIYSWGYLLIFLILIFNNTSAQTSKQALFQAADSVFKSEHIKDIDQAYNKLKERALSLELDSLYVELTFQQIEKNGGLLLYTNSEILLENLLINENYFFKKHPKLLLKSIHDLGRFYAIHSVKSNTTKAISEYYYQRYFKLIKTVELNDSELKAAEHNKLKYLLYNKNDSLFYYLEKFKIDEINRADYLNYWYRAMEDFEKELIYAKASKNKIDIIVAHKNNGNFKTVESLFPKYRQEFKENDHLSEHKLYLIMGQYYLIQKRYLESEQMYLKALEYFSSSTFNLYVETIFTDLIKIQSLTGNFQKYQLYIKKLIEQNKAKEEQQLKIHQNHLEYAAKIFDFERHLKNEEEVFKINNLKIQINNQKTIISFAMAFLIVTLIFVYFYSVVSKTNAMLEDVNEEMSMDVLRSKFKPHFTFNVLSVINYFIEKKEMKNAALAITKMAALLRSTLDNMNENLVSFESEYKICDNYMYLESLRFSKKFEYRFKPLKEDVIKQWLIPPGIIEPLLENAVNHAFKGIDYKGLIALNYELSEDYLSVTVSDNGIGMGASNIVSKKSHGLKITRDYIKTVSNLYRKNITIDFVSNNGTTVAIRFPRIDQKKFKKLKK
jgi:hypothetical protein